MNLKIAINRTVTSLAIKRLIYLVLITLSAFIAQSHFSSTQKYWLVWSACILGLITLGDSFKRRIIVMILTGLLAAIAAFLAGCLVFSTTLIAFYLLLSTIACVIISLRYSEYFFVVFIINLFAILSGELAVSFDMNMQRFLMIVLGMSISVFFQLLFYPYFIRNELHSFVIITIKHFKKLNEEIFSCFLDVEYPDNIYLYERRLHVQKNRCMQSMSRLREIVNLASKKMNEKESAYYTFLLGRLDLMYNNMLDYSQLRRRVTDHATFSVCSQELTAIAKEIGQVMEGMIARTTNKKYYLNTHVLVQYIKRLEDNYNNVLQVAAREPLVFLLFLNSLNYFCKTIAVYTERQVPTASSFS